LFFEFIIIQFLHSESVQQQLIYSLPMTKPELVSMTKLATGATTQAQQYAIAKDLRKKYEAEDKLYTAAYKARQAENNKQ